MHNATTQFDTGGDVAEAAVPKARGALYRWYVLALLLLIYIVGSVDRYVVAVLAEPLKHDFRLSDAQIGFLGGMAYSLTFSIAVLPTGWLVDRVGRRVLLSTAVAIWSVCSMASAVCTSYVQLVLARMGVGAAEAPATPASFSLIADIFPVQQRNTASNIYYTGGALGQLVIFVLGGWVLSHFSWQTVFLIAGIPGVLLAALLFFTTREPVRGGMRGPGETPVVAPGMIETMRRIFTDRRLCFAILAVTVSTGVSSTLIIWLTSFFVRVHEVPVHQAAIWVGLGWGLPATISAIFIGPIADRYSGGDAGRLARIPAVTTFLAIFCGIGLALTPTPHLALVGLCAFSFLAGMFNGPGYVVVLSLARPETRGTTMAAGKLTVILIGNGLFPLLTGAASDAIGGKESIRPAIVATAALLSLATIAHLLVARSGNRNRDARAA